MSPLVVTDAVPESLGPVGELELVGRNCKLTGAYKTLKSIPTVDATSTFIAFASPDSTYAVTRRLFEAAKEEIIIGIYDFSADYMKELVLNAMHRGVKVSLKLDIDSEVEEELFEELAKFGAKAVPAPSCASENLHYFPSSHEKVIVIDRTWVIVQSGNYSPNSIPFNETDGGDPSHFVKGNRDMGVAVRSQPLAEFFAKLVRRDMKLELDAASEQAAKPRNRKEEPDLVEAVPKLLPKKLFPSKEFKPTSGVRIVPVLSPDNYMIEIPVMLEGARKSILIEQQYIRSDQSEVQQLLNAIGTAMDANPDLDVRIILGKIFSSKDIPKEKANLANLRKTYGLKLGEHIRYIDTKRFVHCHNKLILVDGKRVLTSSQNWSNSGVSKNREAGLLFTFPAVAKYFTEIFESDWETALSSLPKLSRKGTIAPETLARGGYVQVRAADYQEV